MSYGGETLTISFVKGGLNANPNIENIPPESMVAGSKNIDLNSGGRESRGGTSHYNSAAVTDTPEITGGYEYRLRSGTTYKVCSTSDGKYITVNTSGLDATLKTSLGTNKRANFVELNNKLYICNGNDIVQTWAGVASTAALAAPPADWTGTTQPAQIIKHGYGNSERLWGMAVSGKPNNIYYSKDNDGTSEADFLNTGAGTMYIDTGDGFGITGGYTYQDRLFVVGRKRTYRVMNEDATPANWGYQEAGWNGGAYSWRLICQTDNDIICMMEDGEIYSVTAVQSYGDYKRASLTQPSFIHRWIQDNVDLSKMAQFHMIYDPELRAVRVFVVRKGQTQVDTCLLFYIDRPATEGWSLHDNLNYSSGYKASCAFTSRQSTGEEKVFTGDYAGFVWKMNMKTVFADNGNAINSLFKTPRLYPSGKRNTNKFFRGILIQQARNAYSCTIRTWVDGIQGSTTTTSQSSYSGGLLGSFVLGIDVLGVISGDYVKASFDIGRVGENIEVEVSNNNANKSFYASELMIDFRPITKRPQGD